MNLMSFRQIPFRSLALAGFVSLALAACGGGGSGGGSSADAGGEPGPGPGPGGAHVAGQFVIPQAPLGAQARYQLASALGQNTSAPGATANGNCPDVPNGYDPLANTTVDILDADDQKLGELTTDACGAFDEDVPEEATTLKVSVPGYKDLAVAISHFDSAQSVASPLPTNADLRISAIQYVASSGSIAFSLSDSVTGKAVLGVGQSAVAVINQDTSANVPIVNFSNAFATADPASISLILDASGSMGATVGTTGFTRYDLASAAAHLFIDGKGPNDEIATVIFDDSVTQIDDTFLASRTIEDASGQAFRISDSGFSTDPAVHHVVADFYNPANKVWQNGSGRIDKHPDNPYTMQGSFPWDGLTALWSASYLGVDMLENQANDRRIVVAMTDGDDNYSSHTPDQLINHAKDEGIPVHMIAFGSEFEVNEAEMQRVATETGGEYQRREDDSIADLFTSIQTGIRHQYTVGLDQAGIAGGTPLNLEVTLGADSVSRQVVAR